MFINSFQIEIIEFSLTKQITNTIKRVDNKNNTCKIFLLLR